MSDPQFFNPYAQIEQHTNLLPHWQQPGATYFITFRLADSIPTPLLEQWKNERAVWLELYPEPWDARTEREYHQRFSRQIDVWLDGSVGACWLREPANRMFLADTLTYRDGIRYFLHTWVIMPNHVHVLVTLNDSARLETEIRAWKGVSARRINQRIGRRGAFWQEDYFDRIVRDLQHFLNCARYIRRNPEKAGLRPGEYEWYESDFLRGYEE